MKILSLRSQLYNIPKPSNSSSSPLFLKPIKIFSQAKSPKHPSPTTTSSIIATSKSPIINLNRHHSSSLHHLPPKHEIPEKGYSGNSCRLVIMGAVSVGIFLVLIGIDDHEKAWALGPEGPLMEEFWDNVRRYALYALTVSTGAIYTIFQPIYELLKNPISAILVIAIFGGGFYVVSQVLSAMVGITEFSYDYGY